MSDCIDRLWQEQTNQDYLQELGQFRFAVVPVQPLLACFASEYPDIFD